WGAHDARRAGVAGALDVRRRHGAGVGHDAQPRLGPPRLVRRSPQGAARLRLECVGVAARRPAGDDALARGEPRAVRRGHEERRAAGAVMSDAAMLLSLREDALAVRRKFLRMHFEANAGHLGTGLSDIDILVYLHKVWLAPGDKFILSKGHGASSLYAALHHFGRL